MACAALLGTGAILAANNDPKLPFIYFPPGIYRIATSITITKPIVAGGVLVSSSADCLAELLQSLLNSNSIGRLC
jgi:hypothetical protein